MKYCYEMPEAMLRETENKGTVERFYYDTNTYDAEESHALHKGTWVYLPYGYDTSKKIRYSLSASRWRCNRGLVASDVPGHRYHTR